jgi:DNA polymerase I-like protein with 3'-5' exonuclease and polymerase domains
VIAVDIETFDPDIGNYASMQMGKLLCVGMYDGNTAKCYTPDDEEMQERLASNEPKIFHNGVYDLGWLICGQGLKVGGIWHDTMTRTALIDEYSELDLDSCCKKFKVTGKNYDDTIEKWVAAAGSHFGIKAGKSHWRDAEFLWAAFPDYRNAVVRYNLQDCKATYDLFMAQEPYIKEYQNTYDLECKLYPLIMLMKKRGVRVDPVAIERLTAEVKADLKDVIEQLEYKYNITQSIIASPKKLTGAMGMLGIRSPIPTPSGGQSWSADALELIDHPVAPLILATKAKVSLLNKYLEGSMVNSIVKGRIHTTFSPNKRDTGGTITGRWASANPNLQNISARDEKHGQKTYGTEVRNCFIPDEGCTFGAFDYSAIEAVLLAHYAQGVQADWFKNQIIGGADYHKVVMEMTGITSRDIIKRMNYGFIYGMGLKKLMSINVTLFKQLASEAGMEMNAYGQQLYTTYHARFPVIKDTMKWVEQQARAWGYIDGIGGRRHHKPRPELSYNGSYTVPYYKMTNYLIQGSAAEILKLGLVNAFEAGIFGDLESKIDDEYILHAHLAVHDEVDISIPDTKAAIEAAKDLEQHMVNAYKDKLSVPLKVSCETGASWGASNKDEWKELLTKWQ